MPNELHSPSKDLNDQYDSEEFLICVALEKMSPQHNCTIEKETGQDLVKM